MTDLSETSDHPAVPAATIVLFYEPDDGPARHLMIERAASMAFAAGALVFPGGRLDPEDRTLGGDPALVRNAPSDADDAAARVAAIRELIEETGLAIAVDPAPTAKTILAWREALKGGSAFGTLLDTAAAQLDLGRLIPFARWCPPIHRKHRRFDTRFFLARLEGAGTVEVNAEEAASHRWLTAQEALDEGRAGRHLIIFPTQRNLERLAVYPRFEAARIHAAETPVRTISPEIRDIEGEKWLCIPGDAGYPVTAARMAELVEP